MNKVLEIIEHQSLALYIANKNNIKAILSQNQHTTLNIIDIFNLGVIAGKREERKRKAKVSSVQTDNTINDHIKSLIDEIKSPDALMLVNKYLEAVRQREYY
ncbi:hypothetical protein [Thomasclavelia cocleata]|uniref:hypothetical protein n=1 Tax=Thomasclavelia cocleata TaxID=69824 RepID=UPI002494CD34|nr:hypothetical protein [Thomasclavelia cocleata]